MSNISDRHVFSVYISQGANKSQALSGQRLSVVRFKKDKSGAKAKDSQCVSIPLVQLTANDMDLLAPQITSWFAGVQDEIIRAECVADRDAVTSDMLDVAAVRSYLVQQSQGERLSGEQIGYWFDSELGDVLLVAFADKLGISGEPTDEQATKLGQMVTVYRDCFTALAGGRTMFAADKRGKLVKALGLVDTSGGIGEKLLAKLTAMDKVTVEEMLGL